MASAVYRADSSNPDTYYIKMDPANNNTQSNMHKRDCICNNTLIVWLWPFISFILSYTVLIFMFSEIILLVRIYPQDSTYFRTSIVFLCVATLSASWCTFKSRRAAYNINENENMLINSNRSTSTSTSSSDKWYLCVPIINTPIYKTLVIFGVIDDSDPHRYSVMAMDFVLTVFMILPLYCVNISYLLSTTPNKIPIENIVELTFAFINMTINPIKYILSVNKPPPFENSRQHWDCRKTNSNILCCII
eukprot:UN07338